MSALTPPNRIYHSCKYEFDDESVLDLQREYSKSFFFSISPNDAHVSVAATSLDHIHESGRIVPKLGVLYCGDADKFTKERALQMSVVHILGWIADAGSMVTFERVEIQTFHPSGDILNIENLTLEARVMEAEFRNSLEELHNVNPADF